MTIEHRSGRRGTLPILVERFSNHAFGRRGRNANAPYSISIGLDQIRNGNKHSQESARKRYERVGASTLVRKYNHPFLQSIADQDYERCKSLIEGGVDVNLRDNETGCSALQLASKEENHPILLMLLKNGADCNAQDHNEQSPLHCAVKKDRVYNSQALLERGDLNVNIQNKVNDTPLHVAAKDGRYAICKQILQHPNIQINQKNKKGMTPLHFAAQENHVNILKLLLEKGADWKGKDNTSFLPIHYAANKGYPESCNILLSHDNDANKEKQLSTCIRDGKNPLMLAAKQGHHKCCKLMEGPNINASDKDNHTALHHAVINSFEGTVSMLLDMGANPNTQNKKGVAPILDAASKKRGGCLKALFAKKADIKVFDTQGRGVLHYAAEKNALDALRFILVSADMTEVIDKKDSGQCTPLHIAIKKEAAECAVLLLENSASPVIECAGGMTPLHLAADKGYTSVCENLLSKKEVEVSKENDSKATPLHMAALHGSYDVCQMLIRKGARVTAVDAKERTALHVAAAEGAANAVKYLTKRGVPLRGKDDTGSCALHLAASRGSLECCKILANGAKATCWEVDQSGMLPLDRAFKKSGSDTLKTKNIPQHSQHDLVFKFLLVNLGFKEKQEELMLRIHNYMDIALLENRVHVIEAIVNSSWWHAGITGENEHQCNNFKALIEHHPELALQLMEKCVTPLNDSRTKVSYDFRLLEDNYYIPSGNVRISQSPFDPETHRVKSDAVEYIEDSLEWKKTHPLMHMISHQRMKLLHHPLTKMWLLKKWNAYIYLLFILVLLTEAVFTACLTLYMGYAENWIHVKSNCNNITEVDFCNMTAQNVTAESASTSSNTSVSDDILSEFDSCTHSLEKKFVIWIALLSLTVLLIVKELYVLSRLGKEYLNYVEHKIRIIRGLFIIPIFVNIGTCEYRNMILNVINWQFGIIALLLTWLHFINTLNQLPMFSIFMPVTNKFLKSFIKVLIYIFLVIFIFAFIFYLLLNNQKAFSTLSEAIVKTTAWMLQDLAYDNTFIFTKDHPLMYPNQIKFLFLVFAAFLGGFIVNFIITQPSNQLETFRERACFHRAVNRAELFFKFDICFPSIRRQMTKVNLINDENKKYDYNFLTRKLLMLDTKEDSPPETQLDTMQAQLKQQNKQIAQLVSLMTEQVDEMNDLKHQVTVLTKILPK